MNKKVVVKQDGIKDCAIASVLSVIRYYNGNISKEELSYIIKATDRGTSAYHIIEGVKSIGFDAYGIKKTSNELFDKVEILPLIAHVKLNNLYHYIVVYEIDNKKKYLKVMDPAFGIKKINFEEFSNIFLSSIIILYPVRTIPKTIEKDNMFNFIINSFLCKKDLIFKILLLSIFVIIFTILNNLYFKILIDYLVIHYTNKILLFLTLLFLFIISLKNVFNYKRNKILLKYIYDVNNLINSKVVNHIFNLPYKYFKSRPSSEIVTKIKELERIKETVSHLFLTLFVDSIFMILSFVILIVINKLLFFMLFFIAAFYILITIVYSKILKNTIYSIQNSEVNYNRELTENIEGFETVRNLNLNNERVDRVISNYSKYLKVTKDYDNSMNNQINFKNLLIDISLILILSVGVYFINNNSLTLGDLVTFNTLILFFIEPFKQIIDLIVNMEYIKSSIERINELMIIKPEENHKSLENINGNILIKNLNYSYNDVDVILENININILKKDKILLYGKSGSGKSTLIKILLKYIDNYGGSVYINNRNLKDIESMIIRNSFTFISQNEKIFSDSLINNILLDRKVSNKKLECILKITNVNKIIDSKKFRNLHLIEEDGFNLSGGERQKIILARGLIKNSNYIVLDEALSEVGIDEEIEIIKNIFEKLKDKTIIYISHKRELLSLFEKKYLFCQKGVTC